MRPGCERWQIAVDVAGLLVLLAIASLVTWVLVGQWVAGALAIGLMRVMGWS